MRLHWYISDAGVSGDPYKLVRVHDSPDLGHSSRVVEVLFNTSPFLYRWRLKRVLRTLRRRWINLYISGLYLEQPHEIVR